jgi:hypothetical protein
MSVAGKWRRLAADPAHGDLHCLFSALRAENLMTLLHCAAIAVRHHCPTVWCWDRALHQHRLPHVDIHLSRRVVPPASLTLSAGLSAHSLLMQRVLQVPGFSLVTSLSLPRMVRAVATSAPSGLDTPPRSLRAGISQPHMRLAFPWNASCA